MGSSLHANDPFLIYTNYVCFQLKMWLDQLDHIFLQTSQKSNTNWSPEVTSEAQTNQHNSSTSGKENHLSFQNEDRSDSSA